MSTSSQFDVSCLGHQDAQLHRSLLHVEQQAVDLINSSDQPTLSRIQLNGIERQIKDLLAKLREGIRDLELSSEEQDT